jgi:Zn-dependent protease
MGILDAASDPTRLIATVIAFIAAISVHEACHALAATWLGDSTPKSQGRLTLNPIRHLDPMGTLLLVVAGFGWGKPVTVNPLNLRFGIRRGMAIVSAAGPGSNIAMAALLGPVFRQVTGESSGILPNSEFLAQVIIAVVAINVLLAIFNLIPIPPLDGFGVLYGVVGAETAQALEPLRKYGPLILIGVIFLGPIFGIRLLQGIVLPPMEYLVNLFIGR